MAANASLLDELMGRNRNLAPDEQEKQRAHFDHKDVCKYYLCGFCPNELFKNTRVDIGPCDKIHDDDLVLEYKKSDRFKKCNYEEDFAKFVGGLVGDIDKRIKRGHQRLKLNNTPIGPPPQDSKEEQVNLLTDRINDMLKQAEELGCNGKVEESQGVLKLVDQLKIERKQLEEQDPTPLSDLKEMEVCGICGAFQVKGDAPSRVEEHINGKQHIGYAKLRSYLQDVDDDRKEREEEERKAGRGRDSDRRSDDRRNRDDNGDDRRRSRDDRSRDERRRSRSPRSRSGRDRSDRNGRYESDRSSYRDRRREEPRGSRDYGHYY